MQKLLRRSWLWGPLLLAAVVGAAYFVVPLNDTRVTKANFEKIQKGWSERQVTDLLGRVCVATKSLSTAD